MSGTVSYGLSEVVWREYDADLLALVAQLGVKRICEVGGGANPALPLEFITAHGIEYTLLDIDQGELDKAGPEYSKIRANICVTEDLPTAAGFDFIFTKMLAEHVKSGADLHRNIFTLLAPGGYAFHFFPTLFAIPFVVNRLVPERLASWILDLLSPRDKVYGRKFPAFYSWCFGPTGMQIARFERIGYEVVAYKGIFGAEGYYSRIPIARTVSKWLGSFLASHPIPWFTAYSQVLLRRPI